MPSPGLSQEWANMIILGFQSCAPHFLPHFLLTLFQKKLERRKYIYFCFKKRLSKYVKRIGWNRLRMGISEKARGEKYSTRTLQWPLIFKVKYQAFLVKEKIPSIHREPRLPPHRVPPYQQGPQVLPVTEFLWRFIKWGTETGDTQENRVAASDLWMLYSLPSLCIKSPVANDKSRVWVGTQE